jgi:hypothetical protein
MNSMAVHGLAYVLRVDLGDRERRHILPEIQEKAVREAVHSQKRSDPHNRR